MLLTSTTSITGSLVAVRHFIIKNQILVVQYSPCALQVVSLLQDAPQCTIPFNRFIPAYHHHFGHQCRLADYGMTKLAELLAAVGDVAEVIRLCSSVPLLILLCSLILVETGCTGCLMEERILLI
jgi:hypothetical protein